MWTRIAVMTVLAGAVAAVPAGASPGGHREVKKAYTGAGSASAPTAEAHNYCLKVTDHSAGSACFTVKPADRLVSVTVEDAAGGDVAARIVLEGRKDVSFCGATRRPVAIPSKQKELPVALEVGGCGDPAGTIPTSGTITATFTK